MGTSGVLRSLLLASCLGVFGAGANAAPFTINDALRMNLMDIVPLDDTLLVEGRLRPQDIAFLRPGQDAVVKLTAYDSSVFGSLKGKVERISADTIIDDKSKTGDKPESFYRVMIRTDKNYLGTQENPLPIIPGMVATVEVLTGKKSVLDYLVKPARMLGDEAFRER